MRLGTRLMDICDDHPAGELRWKWHVEPHQMPCECPEKHDAEGRVTSSRFVTLDVPCGTWSMQLCIFSGDRNRTAYVRVLDANGKCTRVLHVPGGAHAPIAESIEEQQAWVRGIIPRLFAAATDEARRVGGLTPMFHCWSTGSDVLPEDE